MPALGKFEISDKEHFEQSIYEIVSRHPLNQTQMEEILNEFEEQERKIALQSLLDSSRIKQVKRYEKVFWIAEEACFGEAG